MPEENFVGSCHKWQFGNGDRLSDRYSTMMFNWTMLKYVGENGVAAITIIMYVLMFATSLYTLAIPTESRL